MRLIALKVHWHVASNIKIAMITASMQMVSCLLYVERKDVSSIVNIITKTRVEREANKGGKRNCKLEAIEVY